MTKYQDQKTLDKMFQKMGITLPEGRARSAPTINKDNKKQINEIQEANIHECKFESQQVQKVKMHKDEVTKYVFEEGKRLVKCWADEPAGCDRC